MRVAFVTNMCPHYRVPLFENLARRFDVDYFFFSDGSERYWNQRNGTFTGAFRIRPMWHVGSGSRWSFTPQLPLAVSGSEYDVVVKCTNGRLALPAVFAATQLSRKPFVLWTGLWEHPRTVFHRLSFPFMKLIYRRADAIVVYGAHVKRYLEALGIEPAKIFLAPQTVQNRQFSADVPQAEVDDLRRRLGLDSAPVIVCVGRLVPEKGHAYLVSAFQQLLRRTTASLLLIGDGPLRDSIQRQCDAADISARVHFIEHVPNTELARYYALASAMVLPSISTPTFREPWGLVVNEAMNSGLPVIATDAVGAAAGGLVLAGVTGAVVPERNADALAHAMVDIVSNPALRASMSQASRERVLNWNYDAMAGGFVEALQYALGRHRSVSSRA